VVNEKVWYCKDGHSPMATIDEGPVQCECGKDMTNIGWIETDADAKDDSEKD
jgi:hypothetical protein